MATKFAEAAQSLPDILPPNFLNHYRAIDTSLSSGMAATADAMSSMLTKAQGLIARRQMADATMTRAANLLQIEKVIDSYKRHSLEAFAKARASLLISTKGAEMALETALGIKPTQSATTLQDRLAAMSATTRTEAVAKAFATNDRELIGAIVGFHPLVHGCAESLVEPLLDKFKREMATKEYASLAAHRQAMDWLQEGEFATMRFLARAYSGTEDAVAKQDQMKSILASYGMILDDGPSNDAGFAGKPIE